ncbi:hypothetical protein AVEN_70041-1 [Araneus ventricosus]|uniref:Uncharacterized protein n=1 Tax=Araneus ventricosus TaxID=182803 RepID=A0A4Y2NJJ8_ARAVE|nr:hypothetical protein AVEN_58993-1 [Araneus ventricosus]GBN38730.1 hypothetical protein AVEN_70041-1 [Araneus ventricosus]
MRKRVPALLILAANSRSCTWTSLTRRRQEKGLHTEDRHNAEESITVSEHISGTLWKGAVGQPEYHYPVKEKIGGASPLHPPPEEVNKTDVRGETGGEKRIRRLERGLRLRRTEESCVISGLKVPTEVGLW